MDDKYVFVRPSYSGLQNALDEMIITQDEFYKQLDTLDNNREEYFISHYGKNTGATYCISKNGERFYKTDINDLIDLIVEKDAVDDIIFQDGSYGFFRHDDNAVFKVECLNPEINREEIEHTIRKHLTEAYIELFDRFRISPDEDLNYYMDLGEYDNALDALLDCIADGMEDMH